VFVEDEVTDTDDFPSLWINCCCQSKIASMDIFWSSDSGKFNIVLTNLNHNGNFSRQAAAHMISGEKLGDSPSLNFFLRCSFLPENLTNTLGLFIFW